MLGPPPLAADAGEVRTHLDRLTGTIPQQLRAAIGSAFESFFLQLRKHVFPRLLDPDAQLTAGQVAQLAGVVARDITFAYFDLTEELAKAIGRDGDTVRDLLAGTDDAGADERLLRRVEAEFGPAVAEDLARVGADLETIAPYVRATLPATPQEASGLVFGRLTPTFGGALRAGFIRLAITSAALDTSIARRQDVVQNLARVAREDVLAGWIALRAWIKERHPHEEAPPAPSDAPDEPELAAPDWSDL